MRSGSRHKIWENLREYQEDLIVRRISAAVENCLHDLGVSPSHEELEHLKHLSRELAKSPAVRRGIRSSCCDIWEKLYRRMYGAPPDHETVDTDEGFSVVTLENFSRRCISDIAKGSRLGS